MLDARFSHLYFYQSLNRLQRGLSAIAELLVQHRFHQVQYVFQQCLGFNTVHDKDFIQLFKLVIFGINYSAGCVSSHNLTTCLQLLCLYLAVRRRQETAVILDVRVLSVIL